jgi:ElaB/YqjD/DUF883 family membrane-anchored ribosome-binding protein
MNEVGSSPKPLGQEGKDLSYSAVNKVRAGTQSTQQSTNKALDRASDRVDEIKSDVAPALDELSGQAQEGMQKGRDVFNDTAKIVRGKAAQASDMALAYTQDEPIKAILIAAATGAVLMGLVAVMARSPRSE